MWCAAHERGGMRTSLSGVARSGELTKRSRSDVSTWVCCSCTVLMFASSPCARTRKHIREPSSRAAVRESGGRMRRTSTVSRPKCAGSAAKLQPDLPATASAPSLAVTSTHGLRDACAAAAHTRWSSSSRSRRWTEGRRIGLGAHHRDAGVPPMGKAGGGGHRYRTTRPLLRLELHPQQQPFRPSEPSGAEPARSISGTKAARRWATWTS